MTKSEMAYIITESPAWDGRSAEWLIKHCSKQEIKDYYDELNEAENDYYDNLYGSY